MTQVQHAAIAEQAYYLWLDDGMIDGRAEAHWMAAEKILVKAATSAPARTAKSKAIPKAAKKASAATRASRIRATETRLHS